MCELALRAQANVVTCTCKSVLYTMLLLAFYQDCCSLIGYAFDYLFGDR